MKINGDNIDDIYNKKRKVIIFEFVLENFLSNSWKRKSRIKDNMKYPPKIFFKKYLIKVNFASKFRLIKPILVNDSILE